MRGNNQGNIGIFSRIKYLIKLVCLQTGVLQEKVRTLCSARSV